MRLLGKTRESSTLQLLIPALALLGWKFFASDIMSATEFAAAYAALMAVWLTREWRSAHYKVKEYEAKKTFG